MIKYIVHIVIYRRSWGFFDKIDCSLFMHYINVNKLSLKRKIYPRDRYSCNIGKNRDISSSSCLFAWASSRMASNTRKFPGPVKLLGGTFTLEITFGLIHCLIRRAWCSYSLWPYGLVAGIPREWFSASISDWTCCGITLYLRPIMPSTELLLGAPMPSKIGWEADASGPAASFEIWSCKWRVAWVCVYSKQQPFHLQLQPLTLIIPSSGLYCLSKLKNFQASSESYFLSARSSGCIDNCGSQAV